MDGFYVFFLLIGVALAPLRLGAGDDRKPSILRRWFVLCELGFRSGLFLFRLAIFVFLLLEYCVDLPSPREALLRFVVDAVGFLLPT